MKHISSVASIKLPDGVVSVFDDVFVASVDGLVSEKGDPGLRRSRFIGFCFRQIVDLMNRVD